MSGGIDNIYGAEWEWSIFLSGAVTPLAKLHHGQLPRQTPSSLLLPLLPGTGPHLHGYIDPLDTIKIRQSVAKKERRGRRDTMYDWIKKKVQVWCVRGEKERGSGGWERKGGLKLCVKCKERAGEGDVCSVLCKLLFGRSQSSGCVVCWRAQGCLRGQWAQTHAHTYTSIDTYTHGWRGIKRVSAKLSPQHLEEILIAVISVRTHTRTHARDTFYVYIRTQLAGYMPITAVVALRKGG